MATDTLGGSGCGRVRDIEALERRIDELCAENERLRLRHKGYVVDLQEALTENTKLRELVRFIMHQCNDGDPRCNECIGWNNGECVALMRMRELGIEVDE